MFHFSFVLTNEMWSISLSFLCSPLKKKRKEREKDKHNDAVPVSNFVSRSICSPQFDAASIKTEQHSFADRMESCLWDTSKSPPGGIKSGTKAFQASLHFQRLRYKQKKKKKKVLALLPCAVSIFCFGTPIR